MNLETTEEELMHTIFPHPTLSEMMKEAVLDAYGRVLICEPIDQTRSRCEISTTRARRASSSTSASAAARLFGSRLASHSSSR